MPRETQDVKLARYRDRIDGSRSWRENQGYVSLWRRMIDLYRGKQSDSIDATADQAIVNLAFSVLNIIVASSTTQYPKFTVSPNQIDQGDQAQVAEAVLNYAWRHHEFQPEFTRAVIDMGMMGHGWLKIGWRYKSHKEDVTLQPDEQMMQVHEQQAQADAVAAYNPASDQMPSDEEIAQQVEPTQRLEVVDKDDPFVERVSPFDMVVDPEATCERDLRWIAQRVIRDLQEVKDDETYDARARHKVQADMSIASDDVYNQDRSDRALDDDEHDRVTIWEFYDLLLGEWAVFAESGDGFLVKPGKIPYDFDNCYIQFRDYDVPDVFYPMGEIEAVETLQEELNKTRTQQVNARKQYVRKFIGREAALSERARTALTSEIDGDVALVEEDDRPLTDIIIPAPSLTFDPQIFIAHSTQIVNDVQMVTGLSDYQFGQMPDTRRLATEAMAVEGSTNARSSYKLTKVEHTLAIVGRRLLQVMQQYMDTERVARISGPGGEMMFHYNAEDIKGEFDLDVEAGSTQPKNDMIRRQEAVTLFNTLAPYMGTLVDPQALITNLLQQGYDMKNVDRFLIGAQPAIDPMTGQPQIDPATGQPVMQQPGMTPPGMPGMGGPPGGPEGSAPPPGGPPGGAMGGPPPPETNGSQPPIPAGVG